MKKKIISIKINEGTKEYYYNRIKDLANQDSKNGYVCFSNVHMLIEAYDNPEFAKVVNSSIFSFPDGYPIAKSFKVLYGIKQERIAGMDFFPEFLQICNENKFRVAFIGSTNEILEKLKCKLIEEFPGIQLTNLISPPFKSVWDNKCYVNSINKSNTDIVFVALGCPKQEKWMYENYRSLNSILFGIGGALPTFVGEVERAPEWMQKNGLEWFYRLYKEPRRMFNRYLYTNSKFMVLMFLEKFKIR